MKKKIQLREFTKSDLLNILNEFGQQKRIFNSESQFQFDLAWRIKELVDCEIRLEELSRKSLERITNKKGQIVDKEKKDYTDIILEKGECRIGIELKYKTIEYKNDHKNIYLKTHGAVDLGSYDFLLDIHRLEKLVNSSDGVTKPCQKGFSIILTNDPDYWKPRRNTNTVDCEFRINQTKVGSDVTIKQGEHKWRNKPDGTTPKISKDRPKSIVLLKEYITSWSFYTEVKDGEEGNKKFKYLIVEL